MTKDELIVQVVAVTGQTHPHLAIDRETAKAVVHAMMNTIVDAVSEGRAVHLRRFGTFGQKLRRAKTGRNIHAGTQLTIPAHIIPEFVPSNEFKAIVREAQPVF